jgi:hypothetical protein
MRRFVPLLSLAAMINGLGCAASSTPCATSTACGDKMPCVAGLCRPPKFVPAPSQSQRVVLEPTSVALVTSRQQDDGFQSADIPFGRESAGHVALLLSFPAPFGETSQIRSAFVVLDPMPGSLPGPAPVELRLARIVSPWTPQEAAWSTLPRMSGVEGTFLASTWGSRRLWIDVTEQVRRWRDHRSDDHGLAVIAAPQNPVGASYALGIAGGRGPRLDVYLR